MEHEITRNYLGESTEDITEVTKKHGMNLKQASKKVQLYLEDIAQLWDDIYFIYEEFDELNDRQPNSMSKVLPKSMDEHSDDIRSAAKDFGKIK